MYVGMLFRKIFHVYLLFLMDICMNKVKDIHLHAYIHKHMFLINVYIYLYTYIYIHIHTYTCTSNVLLFEKFFHDFFLVLKNVKSSPCRPVWIGCEDNLWSQFFFLFFIIQLFFCTVQLLFLDDFFHVLENVKSSPCRPVLIGSEDILCIYEVNSFCLFL